MKLLAHVVCMLAVVPTITASVLAEEAGHSLRGVERGDTAELARELEGVERGELEPICTHVVPNGCVRYVRGFDITGVTNTIVFTFQDGVTSACGCLKKCVEHKATCANFVFKFTDNSGYRTCTLYSNFNLPPGTKKHPISLGFAGATSTGLGVIADDPQAGGLVPQCTLDGTSGVDPHCVSGPLWSLDTSPVTLLC